MRVLLAIQQTLKSMDNRLKNLESRQTGNIVASIEEELSNLVALPLKSPANLDSLEFDLLHNNDVKRKFVRTWLYSAVTNNRYHEIIHQYQVEGCISNQTYSTHGEN